MHFFVLANTQRPTLSRAQRSENVLVVPIPLVGKFQETHQHCMLDRPLFASPQKAWQKRLCHMVASRCESHFSLLANVYRWLNMEIEQLANLKRTLRILANEWLVQWFQGFENVYYSARQIVPRRNLIVPHEMSVKIRRERRLLIANFYTFY